MLENGKIENQEGNQNVCLPASGGQLMADVGSKGKGVCKVGAKVGWRKGQRGECCGGPGVLWGRQQPPNEQLMGTDSSMGTGCELGVSGIGKKIRGVFKAGVICF